MQAIIYGTEPNKYILLGLPLEKDYTRIAKKQRKKYINLKDKSKN